MTKKKIKFNLFKVSGFTLIELLLVVAVIAILAAFTFVALNPLARFQDSRNARRWSDINAILSAVKLYQVDHDGSYPDSIDGLVNNFNYQIGSSGSCNDSCPNPNVILQIDCVDLEDLINYGYLHEIPVDPNDTNASDTETRYYLTKNSDGTITVGSCSEERGTNASIPWIEVTR